jgi:hypothetical protein
MVCLLDSSFFLFGVFLPQYALIDELLGFNLALGFGCTGRLNCLFLYFVDFSESGILHPFRAIGGFFLGLRLQAFLLGLQPLQFAGTASPFGNCLGFRRDRSLHIRQL